jgi:hypothetical protein
VGLLLAAGVSSAHTCAGAGRPRSKIAAAPRGRCPTPQFVVFVRVVPLVDVVAVVFRHGHVVVGVVHIQVAGRHGAIVAAARHAARRRCIHASLDGLDK